MRWKLHNGIHCCNATAQESGHLPPERRYLISIYRMPIWVFFWIRMPIWVERKHPMHDEQWSTNRFRPSVGWHGDCPTRPDFAPPTMPSLGIMLWAENSVEDICACMGNSLLKQVVLLVVLFSSPRSGFAEKEKCTNSETPYQTKPPTQNPPKGRNYKKLRSKWVPQREVEKLRNRPF